jgi:WD40 repeat protein
MYTLNDSQLTSLVVYLSWSPDGGMVATSHAGGEVAFWDLEVRRLHQRWTPYAVGTRNGGVLVWDVDLS